MVRAYKKKYHFIYKTTNLVNGTFYVGMHSTDDLNDGYIGSGKRLWRSVEKYGRTNFKTEILEQFETRELLVARERELVNEDLLKDPRCMNLKIGGEGGGDFDHIAPEQRKLNSSKGGKTQAASGLLATSAQSETAKAKRQATNISKYGNAFGNRFDGQHSEETKNKISESMLGKQAGEKNSQFGKCWVFNETESIKISKSDLESYLESGWTKGRRML